MPTKHMTGKEKKIEYARIQKEYKPKYAHYTYDMYVQDLLKSKLHYVENMSAKEPLSEEVLEDMLNNPKYYAEQKFDGERADLHFQDHIRQFSRNISKKTDWFGENTDAFPLIRDLNYPEELKGTVLDGEYIIEGGEFKDISSLMRCNWEEAILRYELTGVHPTFLAFDILYYKGVCVMQLPLKKRKDLLSKVIKSLDFEYIKESKYTTEKMHLEITDRILSWLSDEGFEEMYPTLTSEIYRYKGRSKETPYWDLFSKQAWYEYILLNDGEGMMLKDSEAKYYMKRGREFTKYKKFDTWDVIIMGYQDPTIEYTGKDEDNWIYWYHPESSCIFEHHGTSDQVSAECFPVTKHFAKGWIGTVEFGVIVDDDIIKDWVKRNPKEPLNVKEIDGYKVLCVGDTSGFDEETRAYITEHKEELIGKVIEVKGHERIKKTSRIRHPRFVRFRYDKNMEQCTWEDHQH